MFRIKKYTLCVCLVALNFAFLVTSSAQTVDRILAIVNDQIITQSDVSDLSQKLKKNGFLDEALLELYDRKKLTTDNKALLAFLIDERILDTEVARQGLISPIEQVEGKIREIAKSRRVDISQLRAALKSEGVSYSDYQDFIRTSLQRQNLIQKEVTSKIKVSDEDVQAYYVQTFSNAQALTYEYSLSHIVFLRSNGGQTEAKKRADDVFAKIKSGQITFEQAAAKSSEDPDFTQGGAFGRFKLSDLNKNIADVVRPLGASDVSPVTGFSDGYRIFKVTRKTLVPSPDLERRREEIRARLMAAQFSKQFRLWLDQKRKEAYLHLN